jgi:hypothetical protein
MHEHANFTQQTQQQMFTSQLPIGNSTPPAGFEMSYKRMKDPGRLSVVHITLAIGKHRTARATRKSDKRRIG